VKDPVKRVPRSMVLTVVINSIFAYAFIICLLYSIGDLDAVQSSKTGYPIIEVYYLATNSKAGTNVLMVMIIIVSTIGCFSIFASVTRLVWAFARDKGLPFADFFAYVSSRHFVPPLLAPFSFLITNLVSSSRSIPSSRSPSTPLASSVSAAAYWP
jgi:choline transport protein